MKGRPKIPVQNPWGLTPGMARVMDAVADVGRAKLVARRLSLTEATVHSYTQRVREKMGERGRTGYLAKWIIWRQGAGKDVPA